MEKGIVMFFDPMKGFGKITSVIWGEVFVHINDLREAIHKGDQVVFKLEKDQKGRLKATEVRIMR